MDRILKTPKSPSCMGCDYGLRVNILEDGEGVPGRSCIIDHVAKLNGDDGGAKPTTVRNFSRQMGLMIMGGTGYPQTPPGSTPLMQRFLREVVMKYPDDSTRPDVTYLPRPMKNDEEDNMGDGEGSTGKSYNLDCAAELNFEEPVHKVKRTVHAAYKVIGGTKKRRHGFCYYRLLHIRPSNLGYIDTAETSFPSDYISTCPEFTGSVRMFGIYEDEKHTAMIFSYNRSDFDGMTLEEASSLAGTQHVVNWRAGNPRNGQFGVVDCSGPWGSPKWKTKEDLSQPIYTSPGLSPMWPVMNRFSVNPLIIDERMAANEKMEEMDWATKLEECIDHKNKRTPKALSTDGQNKAITDPLIPIPMKNDEDNKEEICLKFWKKMWGSKDPDTIKGGMAYLEKHMPERVWPEHNQIMAHHPMEEEEESSPFGKYAEAVAITTMINEEAGVMGWDCNGHSGTFGIKCPICSEYLTEDEPKKKQ